MILYLKKVWHMRNEFSRPDINNSIFGLPITINSISKIFLSENKQTHALSPINAFIDSGEFISIVGPSGCGKSTLLKIIAGLISPTSGNILIGEKFVNGPFTNLGFVFQSPVLLDWHNVLDNVLMQISLRGEDISKYSLIATQLLEKVGLADFIKVMPRELSGGMKQRVAIVRALIHQPPLLLMDEPFGALDALTREQMRIDLEKLWLTQNQTTIFVTHGISEAVALADRVIVMTPRPASIDKIIKVDLPRPRNQEILASEKFHKICNEITDCFMRHGVIKY